MSIATLLDRAPRLELPGLRRDQRWQERAATMPDRHVVMEAVLDPGRGPSPAPSRCSLDAQRGWR